MATPRYSVHHQWSCYSFELSDSLNMSVEIASALAHFGLPYTVEQVSLRSCLDFTEVKDCTVLQEVQLAKDSLARCFCLCVDGQELEYHIEEEVPLEGQVFGNRQLLYQLADNLYHDIDIIAELIDNHSQASWLNSEKPVVRLMFDIIKKAIKIWDNGQGIPPSEGASLAQLMKSRDSSQRQAQEAKQDAKDMLSTLRQGGPSATLFLLRKFRISEHGFGLKAVAELLRGQGGLRVLSKCSNKRPMLFKKEHNSDGLTRSPCSSGSTGSSDSFTEVGLEDINTERMWDKSPATSPAGARQAKLTWAEDVTKGLLAQYQLYLNSPTAYAKRLLQLIYWQDATQQKLDWVEGLGAQHDKKRLRAMAAETRTILQQTYDYKGIDVDKKLTLQVEMRDEDGDHMITPPADAPESRALQGDSYVERLLRSAAACWPIGLEVPPKKGSQGGHLMLFVIITKEGQDVEKRGPEFPQGLQLLEAVAFMESRQFTRGIRLLDFLVGALDPPSNMQRQKANVLRNIRKDRLHGIALIPRTCETTLGKTGITISDHVIPQAEEMLKELGKEAREFLYAVGRESSPPFRLPESGGSREIVPAFCGSLQFQAPGLDLRGNEQQATGRHGLQTWKARIGGSLDLSLELRMDGLPVDLEGCDLQALRLESIHLDSGTSMQFIADTESQGVVHVHNAMLAQSITTGQLILDDLHLSGAGGSRLKLQEEQSIWVDSGAPAQLTTNVAALCPCDNGTAFSSEGLQLEVFDAFDNATSVQGHQNQARQIGVVAAVEWPDKAPQACSSQDLRIKLRVIPVASDASGTYQALRPGRSSAACSIPFSAVDCTACLLSSEEYKAAFPGEQYACPAATCLEDQDGRMQQLVAAADICLESLSPAWRRLEVLVQCLGPDHQVQSAICRLVEIEAIGPSSFPARLALSADAMLHTASLDEELDGAWMLLAPAKTAVESLRALFHNEGGSALTDRLQHPCQVVCSWEQRRPIMCPEGHAPSMQLPAIIMPAADQPAETLKLELYAKQGQAATHTISLQVQGVPKQLKQEKILLDPECVGSGLKAPALSNGNGKPQFEAQWDEEKAAFEIPAAATSVASQQLGNHSSVIARYRLEAPGLALQGAFSFGFSDELSQQEQRIEAHGIISAHEPQEIQLKKGEAAAKKHLKQCTARANSRLNALRLPALTSAANLVTRCDDLQAACSGLGRQRTEFLERLDAVEEAPIVDDVLDRLLRSCITLDRSWLTGYSEEMKQALLKLEQAAEPPEAEEVDLSEDNQETLHAVVQAARGCLTDEEVDNLTTAILVYLRYHWSAAIVTSSKAANQPDLDHAVVLAKRPAVLPAPFQTLSQSLGAVETPEGCLGPLSDFLTVQARQDQMFQLRSSLECFSQGALVFKTAQQVCLYLRQCALQETHARPCISLDRSCAALVGPSTQGLIIGGEMLDQLAGAEDDSGIIPTPDNQSRLVPQIIKSSDDDSLPSRLSRLESASAAVRVVPRALSRHPSALRNIT
ncbi:hypothetical protein WJX84_000409 [Apatococcus fuscideae]|uniref:Uncharacterized protein n=1 Tax=Apatococcus fuscideae TaxID=2026836 RepID=A0AAW1T6W4_9CHLO